MTTINATGWRCTWRHPSGGESIGDLWEDRETAEWIAAMLRDSGWVLDVRVVKSR